MKDPVGRNELPRQCRRWDAERGVWVPKTAYRSEAAAQLAIRKGRPQVPYRCQATTLPEHFHIGRIGGQPAR